MSLLTKVKELVATYKVIAGAIAAVLGTSSLLGIGYVYVQKADANEIAIIESNKVTAEAIAEIQQQYTPMPFSIDMRISATKNARQTRLNSLEISKSAKEKRRERIIDKHPNIKTLPANNTAREEYATVIKAIEKLERKIEKIEDQIEAESARE